MPDLHLILDINSLPHTTLDYADNESVFMTHNGIDFLCCMYEVEAPEVNRYRVRKVDLATGEIWIRKALGKAEDDLAHLITPSYDENLSESHSSKLIRILLSQGDDERGDNGDLVHFPIRLPKRTDIRLRFFSHDKMHSVVVNFRE